MTDFCDFVPEDPSCAPKDDAPIDDGSRPDIPVDVDMDSDDDMDMDMDKEYTMMQKAMMPGNLAFLGLAVEHGLMAGLELFRYRSSSTYYDDADTIGMSQNWWKYANLAEQWTALVLGGVLTISQLLSMFGVGASVNMMMWGYSTMLVFPLVMGVSEMMRWAAYDKAYQVCQDSSDAAQSTGCDLQETVETEMLYGAVKEIGTGIALYEASEEWMHAQFMQLSEEQQKEMMEMHKMDMEKKESDYEKMMDDDMEKTFSI
jgi:hypothetical protein